MRTPLVEQLPAGALASFDTSVEVVDHRLSVGGEVERSTLKAYRRRYRRYTEWCAQMGYQVGPDFISTEKVTEFVTYCCTTLRYAVKTVRMTSRALEFYAERAGKSVSTREARAVIKQYRDALAEAGFGEKRTGSRHGRGSRGV